MPAAPLVVVPESLPQVAAIVIVGGSNISTALLSCLALLAPASATPPPLSQSLDRVSSRDVLSSVSGAVALVNGSAAGVVFAGVTAASAHLGQALALYAECTWVPTGERLRLPPLFLAIANVSLALVPSTSLLVEAYESAGIAAAATLSPAGAATFAGADATCTWRASATTISSLALAASSATASWAMNASGAVVGGQPLAATVEGQPSATLTLQLVCALWGGNTVVSPPLNLTSRAYAVALQAGPATRTVWPSGAQAVLSWAPALDVTAPARSVLTCSLSTVSSNRGAGLGMSDTAVQVVGDVAVSVVLDAAATRGNASLSRVGLRAPGGSNATLAVACRDGVGRTATAGSLLNVSVAALTAGWDGAMLVAMPTVVAPGQALPTLTLTVASSPVVVLPPDVEASSLVTCVSGLFAASTPLPLSTSLATLTASALPFASVSTGGSGAMIGAGAGNTSIVVAMPALSTATCPLSAALVVAAECTWVPTGERLRLPSLPLSVANVSLALTPSTSLLVEAYESAAIAGAATLTPPGVASMASAAATCTWRAGTATTPSIVLAASIVASSWTLDASGIVTGGQPLALTVEGPPGATLALQLVCSLWGGNTIVSPPLNVTTANYAVMLHNGGGTGTPRAVWPSGTQAVLPLVPPLDVSAPARSVLTCSVEVAGVVLPSLATAPGVGLGLADTSVQLVGEPSVSVSLASAATRANVSLPRVGLRASGGANASLALVCRDGVGRSSALGVPINVSVAALAAAWTGAPMAALPSVLVPSPELPALTLAVASTPAGALPSDIEVASLLSCVAGIFRASTPLPLTTPLATLIASASPFASSSTSTTTSGATITTGAENASIVVTLPPLSTATCPLATQLTVAAECTWTPTGERVRLPPLATSTLQVTLAWAAPPAFALAYTPLPLSLTATVSAPATSSSGTNTTATCEVVLVNATVRSTRLVADPWSLGVDGSASGGTSIPTSVNATVQAPPATELYVQVACTVWGQVLGTPPLRLTTASLEARILSALPSTFIASDASSPWPVDPPLVAAVVTPHDDAVVADATCAVSASTPATDLVVVNSATTLTSLRSIPTNSSGAVVVPQFVVQTSPAMANVTLVVECQHLASGDAVVPLNFTIPATLLTVEPCVLPATKSTVGDPLPAFSVGVAVTPPGGTPTSPCTAATSPTQLPPIVCTITLNASASTINDTSSVFLQHTAVVASTDSQVATFDAFTLVVPQGQTYGLRLSCAIGGLAIPPALAFAVEVDGCRAGQASESVTCVTCGGGQFSLGGIGARCIGCPPAGATCVSGILSLLPHYFRPAAQAGQPLGPTTELHPCYNSEACTLAYDTNVSNTAAYGCAYGYSGPLCGVCDEAVNYARFGAACAECWSAGASWTLLLVVLAIVLAVLTRVALRKGSGRSDAAILLRITLGYLQAVGSLRVFRAGSTKAYDSVMGWTEVVSASPLSVGALQCILRPPYLFQYVATILLPVLASAAVVAIFHAVTTGQTLRCNPRCGMDTAALRLALTTWWATKRHLSTLLFVLFLAYMPIVSASLRALDCIDPVAGVRYLRSDLRVECSVGQHAVARALAYTVLIIIGAGFPAGLAWLLGTARNDQLADTSFRATWGFLFDGYRAPSRTVIGSSSPPLPPPPTPLPAGSVLSSGVLLAGVRKKLSLRGPPGMAPTGNSGGGGGGGGGVGGAGAGGRRRRSALVPKRLTQAWVVSGDSRVWWEAVVLCRKAGVVLLAVTLTNPYLQCVGASLWFLAATALQLRYSPYVNPLFNALETATLVTTLLTAIISTALLQYNVGVTSADLHPPDAMTDIEWTVTVTLAVLNVGTFAVLAGLWLRAQCVQARSVLRRGAPIVAALARRVRVRSRTPAPPGGSIACRDDATAAGGTDIVPPSTVNPLHARDGAPGIPAGTGTGASRAAVIAVSTTADSAGAYVPRGAEVGLAGNSAGLPRPRLSASSAPFLRSGTGRHDGAGGAQRRPTAVVI